MIMMGTLAGLDIHRATGWVALRKSFSGGVGGDATRTNMLCAALTNI